MLCLIIAYATFLKQLDHCILFIFLMSHIIKNPLFWYKPLFWSWQQMAHPETIFGGRIWSLLSVWLFTMRLKQLSIFAYEDFSFFSSKNSHHLITLLFPFIKQCTLFMALIFKKVCNKIKQLSGSFNIQMW